MSNKPSKALLAEWDRRLAKVGFEDIEDRDTGKLKSWSGNSISSFKEQDISSSQRPGEAELSDTASSTYHKNAAKKHSSVDRSPKNYKELKVIRRHIRGISYKAIAEELGIHKSTVQYYVDKFRAKRMGIYKGTHKRMKP